MNEQAQEAATLTLEPFTLPQPIQGLAYGVRVVGHEKPIAIFGLLSMAQECVERANAETSRRGRS